MNKRRRRFSCVMTLDMRGRLVAIKGAVFAHPGVQAEIRACRKLAELLRMRKEVGK